MDTLLFRRIVRKGKTESYSNVSLYNWSEPFLNKDLPIYVRIAKEEGMKVSVSSNLSLDSIPHLGETLAEGVDTLIISMSGSTQDVYEINHRGGDIEIVIEHMKTISKLLEQDKIKTQVYLRFLQFSYNKSCEEPLRTLADKFGISFEGLSGLGNPLANIHNHNVNGNFYNGLTTENDEVHDYSYRDGICEMLTRQISIDYAGDVFLCCMNPNICTFKIGYYLELDHKHILASRCNHPICNTCNWPRVSILEEERNARDCIR
jgi:hypothetical protein